MLVLGPLFPFCFIHGMVPSAFQLDLPCTVKPFWKYLHRHMQRCVSMVILRPFKLTIKIIHHMWTGTDTDVAILKFLINQLNLFVMGVDVLPARMYMYHMHGGCPQRLEKGIRYPGTKVIETVVSRHVSGIETWVLCRTWQCSWVLKPVSISKMELYFNVLLVTGDLFSSRELHCLPPIISLSFPPSLSILSFSQSLRMYSKGAAACR